MADLETAAIEQAYENLTRGENFEILANVHEPFIKSTDKKMYLKRMIAATKDAIAFEKYVVEFLETGTMRMAVTKKSLTASTR